MNYSLEKCKKMVDYACNEIKGYNVEYADVEAIINCCFSRVAEIKCDIYVGRVLDGKTYEEIGLDVGLTHSRVRSICMSIASEIRQLYLHPHYLETDITEMSAIYCLGLPNPVYRALLRAGFIIVGELTQMTESDFSPIRGMGKKNVKVLNDTLSKYNLSLKDYEPGLNTDDVRITLCAPKDRNSVDKAVDLGDMSYLKKDIDFTTEEGLEDFYKLNEDFLLCCKRESTLDELSKYFIKHVCNCMNEADVVSAWEKYKIANNIDIEKIKDNLANNQL